MKKRRKLRVICTTILLILIYEFGGILIGYSNQPKVSESFKQEFDYRSFYGDQVGTERACIIEENQDALIERLRMIENAKKEIILSSFEFRTDKSGKDILAALIRASERGVDVKIIVDGISAFNNMINNEYFKVASSCDGIEIRIYNQIDVLKPWKTMGRMHDKYLIVDEEVYLLGGRNTYNYFLSDSGYKNYDRDVLVYNTQKKNKEASVYVVKQYFESVWNSKDTRKYTSSTRISSKKIKQAEKELEAIYNANKEIFGEQLEAIDYKKITYKTNKISLLSNPITTGSKEPTVFYGLGELMTHAKKTVDIHTPYIICNNYMYDTLNKISESVPNAKIMTNSLANNGNPFGAMDYKKNKKKIIDTGLDVYEYDGGISYHAKSITIDDELAIVGSFNLDMRSVYLDTELMIVIDSKEVTSQLQGYMNKYENESLHALTETAYDESTGIQAKEISKKRKNRMKLISYLYPLRFLM